MIPAMEGGLTTAEYLARYRPDLENPADVVSLAMAIEAQALDHFGQGRFDALRRCAFQPQQPGFGLQPARGGVAVQAAV